jgi:asparagine synthase (glutamine-hydrolysing)
MASEGELRRSLTLARSGDWGPLARSVADAAGSYVTVVRTPDETVVFGDLAGSAPVYCLSCQGRVVWSTAATPLAALAGDRPSIDRLLLGMVVAGIDAYGCALPFERVTAVAPGSLLRIGPSGSSEERWFVPRGGATSIEASVGIRDAVVEGVARRAARCRQVSASIGGVDSMALALLAATFASSGDVHGFTYLEDPASTDLAWGADLVNGCPGLRRELVPFEESMAHFNGIEDPSGLPVADLPSCSLPVLGHQPALFRLAAGRGSSDHLSGSGGDQVLSTGADKLVGLLRSRHPVRAINGVRALAREDRIAAAPVIAALVRLSAESYRGSLRRVAQAVRARSSDPRVELESWRLELNWAHPMGAASWLTGDAANRLGWQLTQLAECTPEHASVQSAHDWQGIRRCAETIASLRVLAASFGITLHTPWLDNRVLSWWDALPGWEREPAGEFKPLLVQLAKRLPPGLMKIGRKDTLGVDMAHRVGLRRNAERLHDLIGSSALIEAESFRRAAVEGAVDRAIAGVEDAPMSLQAFVAAELWLAQLDVRPETWWRKA